MLHPIIIKFIPNILIIFEPKHIYSSKLKSDSKINFNISKNKI